MPKYKDSKPDVATETQLEKSKRVLGNRLIGHSIAGGKIISITTTNALTAQEKLDLELIEE